MLLPSNTPPPANGTTPMDLAQLARGAADLQRTQNKMNAAYAAVYGNCTPPGSYAADGVNLMSDIASAPSPALAAATAASASSFVAPGTSQMTDEPVEIVPLHGSAGYPLPTPYDLTTPQSDAVPVLPANTKIPGRPAQTCPPGTRRRRSAAIPPSAGLAPGWGNSWVRQANEPAAGSGLLGWINQHPLMSLGIAVFAGAVLLNQGGQR